jgi:hypothetical protein
MRHYGRIWKTKKPFLSIVDAAFFWNGRSGEQVKRRNGNRKFPMTNNQIKKINTPSSKYILLKLQHAPQQFNHLVI